MKHFFFVYFIPVLLGLNSCTPEPETPTKGNLHLLIAESIAPAVIYQVNEFMSLYRQNGANITFDLVSSENAINRFLHDTTRMIFATRPLSPAERETIEITHGKFLEMTVAYDAVAAVVHPTNPRDRVTVREIRSILMGKSTKWELLQSGQMSKGRVQLFLQDSSDASSYLTTQVLHGAEISAKSRRVASSIQLLQEVSKNPFSIGFVGLSWIDSAKTAIKVLEVASGSNDDADTSFVPPAGSAGKFFSPHPAYIYQSSYPLKRGIYMYSKSLGGDVAAGFSSFVATTEGQRIFLDHGLVPGTQPIKLTKSK